MRMGKKRRYPSYVPQSVTAVVDFALDIAIIILFGLLMGCSAQPEATKATPARTEAPVETVVTRDIASTRSYPSYQSKDKPYGRSDADRVPARAAVSASNEGRQAL